jgi:hypothetical protein
MQFVKLRKPDDILQHACIFLEIAFNMGQYVWVDVVGSFTDESCVKDEYYCVI